MTSGIPRPVDSTALVRRISDLESRVRDLSGQRRLAAATISSGTLTVKGTGGTSPAPMALMSTFAAMSDPVEPLDANTDPGGIRVVEGGDVQIVDGGGLTVNDGGSFSIGDKFTVDGNTGDITMTGRFQSGTSYPSTVIDQDFYGGLYSGILFQTTGPTYNVAGIKANVTELFGYDPGSLFISSGQKPDAVTDVAERSEIVLSSDVLHLELTNVEGGTSGFLQMSTRADDPGTWIWEKRNISMTALAGISISAYGSPITTVSSTLTMKSDTTIRLEANSGVSRLVLDGAAAADTWLYSAGHLNLRPADGYNVTLDIEPRPATGTMWQVLVAEDGALYYGATVA